MKRNRSARKPKRNGKVPSLLVGMLCFVFAAVSFQAMADIVMIEPSSHSATSNSLQFNVDLDQTGDGDWGIIIGGYPGPVGVDVGGVDAGADVGGVDVGGVDVGGVDAGGVDAGGCGIDAGCALGLVYGNSPGQTAVDLAGSTAKEFELGDYVSDILTFDSQPEIFNQSYGSGSSTQYLGIMFDGDTGTIGPQFGWLLVQTDFNSIAGEVLFHILDGAFDNSGNPIQVGAYAVPEPSSILAIGLTGSALLLAYRRRRKPRGCMNLV